MHQLARDRIRDRRGTILVCSHFRGVSPYYIHDLRLADGSACIDTGLTSALPADSPDLDGDGNLTEPIPFDLDNRPRIANGTVDMGAYEH